MVAYDFRDINGKSVSYWRDVGTLDAYYEAELKPWDLAAGEVIAREAGATVISLEGLPADPPTVVAAAPGLQGPLVELLERSASN